ncbi:MAG: dihydrodipicolinate reductase [Planctomycetota bacterium]
MRTIRIIQYGLGPIGSRVTQFLVQRPWARIVAGIDIDPAKAGRDVGALAGLKPIGARVSADAAAVLRRKADVVVLTTTSSLEKLTPQVLACVAAGKHVVTTCEELAYPWQTRPALARRIDRAARARGVAVLATGVNPGFLMDFLPLALSGVCREVRHVTVERIQDAQFRRIPFQQKIGAGLSLRVFAQKKKAGTLRHVGLTESMHMLAAALGWELDRTEDIITPIVAMQRTVTKAMTIPRGHARGVAQTGRGWAKGREMVRLVFRAAVGEPSPRDRVIIDADPPIDSTIKGGVNGDTATCAITVNAIPALLAARPGLRTMLDIAPVTCRA